jgi:serine protease AprX
MADADKTSGKQVGKAKPARARVHSDSSNPSSIAVPAAGGMEHAEAGPPPQPPEWAPQIQPRASQAEGDSNTVPVLVELELPSGERSLTPEGIFGFAPAELSVDESYAPVPIAPSPSTSTERSVERGATVIIRGRITEDRIPRLRSQPGVVAVWLDTPIAPFATPKVGKMPTPLALAPAALLPCPVPPCDCEPLVPKGNIGDVSRFLGVSDLHDRGIRGSGVTVGVVDGGITAEGRPVKIGETIRRIPRVTGGWPDDWGTEASLWGDHGNMTSTDVLGMAPDAEIYDIRISDGSAVSLALAGYEWAITQYRTSGRPQVLSNSWGIFQENWDSTYARNPNHPFTRKVIEAIEEGMIVLFAAGNCGGGECADNRCGDDIGPGRDIWGANGHPRVITVGAVNIRSEFIGYSSRGPAALDPRKPDFCSASHFTGYFNSDSGTSAATPIAAGVSALLKQENPSLTQDQAKAALSSTARDIGPTGWDQHTGWGIINARAAWALLAGKSIDQWFEPVMHMMMR